MARVTDTEVKEIIDTELDTTPFIDIATLLVDDQLLSKGLSTSLLTKLELLLAAHFTAMRERQLKSEEFGDAKDDFLGEEGKNLDFTQ